MKLRPDEVDLVGGWLDLEGVVRADAVCERIAELTSRVLVRVAASERYGDWETLFRDPTDGRLWERTYPQGGIQGGGPPRLSLISREAACSKYGVTPEASRATATPGVDPGRRHRRA